MLHNMKRSSILIMVLMMTIQFALAQQDSNLVRNGTFEYGNVGFKSDCRYFSFDAFVGRGCEGFQDDSIYFSKDPFGVGNVDPFGKKDSLYFSKDAYGESFFVTNDRFYFYEKFWKCLIVDSLALAFRIKQCTDRTYSAPVKDTTGNFLLAYKSYFRWGNEKLWYDSITIKPNTTYSFSCIVSDTWFWPIYVWKEAWRGGAFSPTGPTVGAIKLCVNGKRVSDWLINREFTNEWRILSGKFTSGPAQTRIEISIENMGSFRLVTIDNIVFKEIQPYERVAKEKRFPKLGDAAGVVLPRGRKQDEDWFLYSPRVKKEESVVKIPPVKEEEPITVITPPVEKEEAVIEIPPVIEEEPVVETRPVKEEEPIVKIPPAVLKEDVKKELPPPTEVKEKIEIKAPELSRTVPNQVVVKKKEEIPVIIKKELPVTEKPEPVKPKVFSSGIKISDVKIDETLELSHIHFEKGKSILLPGSIPELKDLTEFMKKNPSIRIRLEGHTESGGDTKKNLVLSENRVREVKKYLVEQGIDDNRIEWIGYGGERPMNSNDNEYLRQKNRRVEVVIIGK
jgi:outer membrane protein OmpA-like peptidoglycan-associated protein